MDSTIIDRLQIEILGGTLAVMLAIAGLWLWLRWHHLHTHAKLNGLLAGTQKQQATADEGRALAEQGRALAQEGRDIAEGGREQLDRHEEQDHTAQDRGHIVTLKMHIIQLINLLRPNHKLTGESSDKIKPPTPSGAAHGFVDRLQRPGSDEAADVQPETGVRDRRSHRDPSGDNGSGD